jgi:hypothetical protein
MGGNFPPRFEDIEVDDLRCERAKEGINLKGVPVSPIRRVVLKNVRVSQVKVPSVVRYVEGVISEGIVMNGAPLTVEGI